MSDSSQRARASRRLDGRQRWDQPPQSGRSGSDRTAVTPVSALRTLSILLVCVSATMAIVSPVAVTAVGGSPTHAQQDVVEIGSWDALAEIGAGTGPVDGHYALVTDLDADSPGYGGNGVEGVVLDSNGQPANGIGFDPILPDGGFAGTFDGRGHEIADLVVRADGDRSVGLFGALAETGEVRNLSVSDAVLSGGTKVGAVVGENRGGTIAHTSVTGSVNGQSNVGGVVGLNRGGTVRDSTVRADANGSGTVGGVAGANTRRATVERVEAHTSVAGSGLHVGGIVGKNERSSIRNVSSSGDVATADLALYVGGIAGSNRGVISESSSTADITAGFNAAGGIAGKNNGRIATSTASGDVVGANIIGGAVGTNNDRGLVFQSAATGDVNASGSNAGGLVGANHGNVTSSHALGDVAGEVNVGGLVGLNRGSFSSVAEVSDSYAAGSVNGTHNVGGLVGRAESGGGVTDSYWNAEATGIQTSEYLPDENGLSSAAIQELDAQTNLTALESRSVWEPTDGNRSSFQPSVAPVDSGWRSKWLEFALEWITIPFRASQSPHQPAR